VVVKRKFTVLGDSARSASLWSIIVLAEQFLMEEASATLRKGRFPP